MSTIRLAFDLGSSNHKVVVARITPCLPPEILYSNSARIPLADALLPDNLLPPSLLKQSLSFLKDSVVNSRGATSMCAIATEVFRIAQNGRAHLDAIRQMGIRVFVLTQKEEGDLAFSSAIVTQPSVQLEAVVWDSGGGSTQWTYMGGGVCRVHPLQIGSAAVRAEYKRLQDGKMSGVRRLREWVRTGAGNVEDGLGKRINSGVEVLGIGGQTSMFALMAGRNGSPRFGQNEVWAYVEELLAAGGEEEKARVLPKMVLLGELMSCYGIGRVTYVETNGSCLGLLASSDTKFWPDSGLRATEQGFGRKGSLFEEVVQGTSVTPHC